MTILSLAPLRRSPPPSAPDAGDTAARQALAQAQAQAQAAGGGAAPAEPEVVRACGWFDSSWELQQGLAVNELPEAELPVAALWFAELTPRVLPDLSPANASQANVAWPLCLTPVGGELGEAQPWGRSAWLQ